MGVKERSIIFKTLKDIEKEFGFSKKRVQTLFNEFLSIKGIPKEAFKFKASWGGWLIAIPDSVYNEFIEFIKNPQKYKVHKSEDSKSSAVRHESFKPAHIERLRARLLADGVDERTVDKVLHTVKFLQQRGLYGRSLISVANELRSSGLPPEKVREISSYYRVALLHEY